MESIKNVVQQVVHDMAEKKPNPENKIQRIWQGLLGGKVTKHTCIFGIKKNQVMVLVDSPAWLFQLNLEKRRILKEIQKEIPDISEIRFKIGKVK